MHPIAQSWIDGVRKEIQDGRGPTYVFSSLVQLGIESGVGCDCDHDLSLLKPPERNDSEITFWLHRHHAEYNQAVYRMLREFDGMIGKLRRVARTDLGRESDLPGYGKIARKDYVRELLANFLTATPNPEWVSDLNAYEMELIRKCRKVDAIYLLRRRSGLSLVDAKSAVDAYTNTLKH